MYDTATVAVAPGNGFFAPPGASLAGTYNYYVCGPLDSTTVTTAGPNCTVSNSPANGVGSATVNRDGTLTNGNTPSGSSNAFTATQAGTYCFLGVYTPAAGSVFSGSSDSSSGECFSCQ